MATFLTELKRRNVFRVAIAYAVSSWVLVQLIELAADAFGAPDWVIKMTIAVLAILFIPALLFSWVYELTPDGLMRESRVTPEDSVTAHTAKKLDIAVIALLVIALGLFAFDRFTGDAAAPTTSSAEQTATDSATQAAVVDENSVAVLPLVDMSPAGDQEYFTDGLTENLLNALAQVREIKVAGRTSSFAFKGKNEDLRSIGEQLNVGNILEGSVQKAGERIRITTQLVATKDGFHLWSETFDRELTDIFAIQDEIATAVVKALRKNILGEGTPNTGYSGNFEAYNAYLLGQSFMSRKSVQDWDKAIVEYERAISIDPEMALAWAGLSQAIAYKTGFGFDETFAAGYERARHAAQQALQLDPQLPEALLALAHIQTSHDWDWAGTEASLRRALSLRPGDPELRSEMASLMAIRGDRAGWLQQNTKALSVDPLNVSLQVDVAWGLVANGQLDEALAATRKLHQVHPQRGSLGLLLAIVHRERGEYAQGLDAADTETFDFLKLTMQAILQYDLGNTTAAQEYLHELTAEYGDDVAYQAAAIYTAWGDLDNAFAWLDRGYAIRDPGLVYIQAHTTFDPLHSDPRYDAFLKKMGFR
ncbi:MAG: hypothetical protein HKO55_00215 [Gammaproteobacteria bacterium]|nr:hypothetical protein [Gammaproteobacteria bacterium]